MNNNISVELIAETHGGCNTYVVHDMGADSAFIVDPGAESKELISAAASLSSLDYILLTHGHFDHIGAVNLLKNRFPNAKIVIRTEDRKMLTDSELNLGIRFGIPVRSVTPDIIISADTELPFGTSAIRVIHTPGHTPGSVSYSYEDMIFTGDTLFKSSCGRTDFPGGDFELILSSLKRIAELPQTLGYKNMSIYPGHMDTSDIDTELHFNRFVSMALSKNRS